MGAIIGALIAATVVGGPAYLALRASEISLNEVEFRRNIAQDYIDRVDQRQQWINEVHDTPRLEDY
jgi:hypothetical protein